MSATSSKIHPADEKISLYKTGKFVDFCRGPHIPSTGQDQGLQVAEHRRRLLARQGREPATAAHLRDCFFSKKDLEEHLHKLEEAKRRDHRVLGKQLDCSPSRNWPGRTHLLASQGRIIRKRWKNWMREEYLKRATRWCTRRTWRAASSGRPPGTRASTPKTCSPD